MSLTWNALSGPTAAKRKSRMIVWGTLVGFGPAFLLFAAANYANKSPYEFPFCVYAPCIISLLLIPLSFTYAVVKHRVLEIPVLLRRSARYLLVQRGSIDAGEEFGEHRLIEVLRGHRQLPVASLVDVVIRRVAEFSGSEQTDDQTLVVALVR